MLVRKISEADIEVCRSIYNYYIENTPFTLEFDTLGFDDFKSRVDRISASFPYLVCEHNGRVIGYAYLDPFGERKGYRYTCDLAIYVDKDFHRNGAGKALVTEIIRQAREIGIRDIISVVSELNTTSLAFHKAVGFKESGYFAGIADKFDKRFGVYYLQNTIG